MTAMEPVIGGIAAPEVRRRRDAGGDTRGNYSTIHRSALLYFNT